MGLFQGVAWFPWLMKRTFLRQIDLNVFGFMHAVCKSFAARVSELRYCMDDGFHSVYIRSVHSLRSNLLDKFLLRVIYICYYS